MIRQQLWYERVKWGILVMLLSSFYMFNTSAFSSMSVVLFSGLLFCLHIVQHGGIIQVPLTAFHGMILAFALFCLASALWANDSMAAITMGITILKLLICMSLIFWCYLEELSSRKLLTAIMWSGVVVAVYTILYYGPTLFWGMVIGSVRIGNDYANANAIGMWSAIGVVLFCYFIINEGWKWQYCMIVLPILIMAMSQSRTALIEVLIGILMVLFFHYRSRKNGLKSLFKIVFALCIAGVIFFSLSQLPVFSGLTERVLALLDFYEGKQIGDGSVIQRRQYIQAGLEQFLKTPIVGVGIGNSYQIALAATGHNTYLHNNFVELLSSGGIIGFCLYYCITAYLLIKLLPFAMRKSSVSDACIIILLIQTLSDYGTVSYYTKCTYFLYAICFLQIFLNEKGEVEHEPV